MVGLRFNSIGVSDGISNGTDGMSYSLQSRDLIADGIETVMGAQVRRLDTAAPTARLLAPVPPARPPNGCRPPRPKASHRTHPRTHAA